MDNELKLGAKCTIVGYSAILAAPCRQGLIAPSQGPRRGGFLEHQKSYRDQLEMVAGSPPVVEGETTLDCKMAVLVAAAGDDNSGKHTIWLETVLRLL